MASEQAKRLAYDAGRAAFSSEPPDRRDPDACPFGLVDHPEERGEWLRGFNDELDAEPDRGGLRRRLASARNEVGS
jgi:hypothetical protein